MTLFINEIMLQDRAEEIASKLYIQYDTDYLLHWISANPVKVKNKDLPWVNSYFRDLVSSDKLLLLSYIRISLENKLGIAFIQVFSD